MKTIHEAPTEGGGKFELLADGSCRIRMSFGDVINLARNEAVQAGVCSPVATRPDEAYPVFVPNRGAGGAHLFDLNRMLEFTLPMPEKMSGEQQAEHEAWNAARKTVTSLTDLLDRLFESTELAADEPDNDGWIDWHGGEQPVPDGTKVCYRLRGGMVMHDEDAESPRWRHSNRGDSRYPFDIVAYHAGHSAATYAPMPKADIDAGAYPKPKPRYRWAGPWIAWGGGACPVHPDTRVQAEFSGSVRPRSPNDVSRASALRWEWKYEGTGGDITAFRCVEEVPANG